MKGYTGTVKVKNDSSYIYKGKTFKILGIYQEYKNSSGMGVFPDGARSYILCLEGTGFEYKSTVIDDKYLENIELFECIELPLDENEALLFAEWINDSPITDVKVLLNGFLKNSQKKSIIPKHNLNTLYSDDEFERRKFVKK